MEMSPLVMQKVLLLLVFSSSIHSLFFIQALPMYWRDFLDWFIHYLWNLHRLFLKYSKAMSCSFQTTARSFPSLQNLFYPLVFDLPWTEQLPVFLIRHVLRIFSYVTHKPMSMTHICRSFINSKRTFQKGQGWQKSLFGNRRSDCHSSLPFSALNYSWEVNE